jgi:hypothetical protein
MAFLGGDALGMELHAEDRQRLVLQAHDDAVVGGRGDLQLVVREARRIEGQGMVARRGERGGQAGEDAAPLVAHLAQLAVHRRRRAHHLAAEVLADRLVAETHTKDRHLAGGRGDRVQADAGAVRVAGAWRNDDALGLERHDFRRSDLVVAAHLDLRPQFPQEVEEVVGEAVVVID